MGLKRLVLGAFASSVVEDTWLYSTSVSSPTTSWKLDNQMVNKKNWPHKEPIWQVMVCRQSIVQLTLWQHWDPQNKALYSLIVYPKTTHINIPTPEDGELRNHFSRRECKIMPWEVVSETLSWWLDGWLSVDSGVWEVEGETPPLSLII